MGNNFLRTWLLVRWIKDKEFKLEFSFIQIRYSSSFLAPKPFWSVQVTFLFKFWTLDPSILNFTIMCLRLDIFSPLCWKLWVLSVCKFTCLNCGIFSWIISIVLSFPPLSLFYLCSYESHIGFSKLDLYRFFPSFHFAYLLFVSFSILSSRLFSK